MPATDFLKTYPIEDLEEHLVWAEVEQDVPGLERAPSNVRSILSYAFLEMVNNAIDHSSGTHVTASFSAGPDIVSFEIVDNGVGVFRHLRRRFSLPDDLAAVSHLAKGKQTTLPDRHSGEGIFFSSRALDRLVLESGETRWTVDNILGDQAVADVPRRRGTRVRGEIRRDSTRDLSAVFAQHTDPETHRFSKSSIAVHLARSGDSFLSRSEARRLGRGLEQFEEVQLNFEGVRELGQGFADEIFRVWANAHPDTRLIPTNMSRNVGMMVRRAIARQGEGGESVEL